MYTPSTDIIDSAIGRSTGDHLLSIQPEPSFRNHDREGLHHTFGPNEMNMVAEGYYASRLVEIIRSDKDIKMPVAALAQDTI